MTEAAGPWNIGKHAPDYTVWATWRCRARFFWKVGTFWRKCILNHRRGHFQSSLSNWFATN